MANIYSDEEKQMHLNQYKVSGKTKTEYARDNSIPEATFRAWVKEKMIATYGMLDLNSVSDQQKDVLKPQVISYKIGLNLRLLIFILFFKTNFFIFTLKI